MEGPEKWAGGWPPRNDSQKIPVCPTEARTESIQYKNTLPSADAESERQSDAPASGNSAREKNLQNC